MELLVDIVSWILMSAGSIFVVLGGIGALRMPDLYTRMHATSMTDSSGSILIMSGIILQAGFTIAAIKLTAILLFLILTSPTSSNALASAALLAGTKTSEAVRWKREPEE